MSTMELSRDESVYAAERIIKKRVRKVAVNILGSFQLEFDVYVL